MRGGVQTRGSWGAPESDRWETRARVRTLGLWRQAQPSSVPSGVGGEAVTVKCPLRSLRLSWTRMAWQPRGRIKAWVCEPQGGAGWMGGRRPVASGGCSCGVLASAMLTFSVLFCAVTFPDIPGSSFS